MRVLSAVLVTGFCEGAIATPILPFEGDAHTEWFEGNFADYIEDHKRRLGVDELIPHRMKHKKFAR